MTNPRHGEDKPLYNTKLGLTVILIIAAVIGICIWYFVLQPVDTTVAGHIAQHVKPNTGRYIAKTPKVKPAFRTALTAMQLHKDHLYHLHHLHHLHVEHLHHAAHLAYRKWANFEYTVRL